VSNALILEYYDELPESRGSRTKAFEARLRTALEKYKRRVTGRYTEGTLQRLLSSSDLRTRRAAVLALGLTGSMKASNALLAGMLHDPDRAVRHLAADALWSLWLRAGPEGENGELHRLMESADLVKKQSGLDALIRRCPNFAEAYNQRAILRFQLEQWHTSIADCQRALKLNPYHYAAAAGMGKCYLELGRQRAALRALRLALRINPNLAEVERTVRVLEATLGEEGRRDDKKQ